MPFHFPYRAGVVNLPYNRIETYGDVMTFNDNSRYRVGDVVKLNNQKYIVTHIEFQGTSPTTSEYHCYAIVRRLESNIPMVVALHNPHWKRV